ncbi:MAG: hypothetical protein ACLP7O_06745 [Terracidiphilus sp.]
MEQPDETSKRGTDKAAIDASLPGSMTISADASARVAPADFEEALGRLFQSMGNDHALVLSPLRLVLLTAELGNAVGRWQSALGLPKAGVSQQPESVAVAKTISWGRDEESARSIIIMADYIAASIIANNTLAISTLAHEFGHVHDYFLRGLVQGFPESRTNPDATDWPRVSADLAEITWSEYAAESVAAIYMTSEDMDGFVLNDPIHLAGVHNRLSQAVWSYKRGQLDLGSLWHDSVTDMSDIFANLGRAIARLEFADNREESLARLVNPDNEATVWRPVIERLVKELESLGGNGYSEWGVMPFSGIQAVIAQGFQAVGLFPTYDGINLHVRVR